MNETEQALGFVPIGVGNDDLNTFKETLLYLIKCDKDVQEAIKQFLL